MLRQARSNVEVGHLVLHLAVSLGLAATQLSRALKLLESALTVVDCRVLAKDEVSASKFGHGLLALMGRVEFTIEGDPLIDLLLDPDICHFRFYKPLSLCSL